MSIGYADVFKLNRETLVIHGLKIPAALRAMHGIACVQNGIRLRVSLVPHSSYTLPYVLLFLIISSHSNLR